MKAASRKRRTTENSMMAGRSGLEADNDNVGYAEYHTACAEEEAIRIGAFVPTDSQKEYTVGVSNLFHELVCFRAHLHPAP